MESKLARVCACGLMWAVGAFAFGQEAATSSAASQPASSAVPRLISFGGVIKDAAGKPVNGAVSVTFSLFSEQEGGEALWSETQVVNTDAQGHYSVFLGSTNPKGLPLDVFQSNEARWLAVNPGVPAAVEASRILLVGVPYALKAADSDTLGGKPASAFVMAAPQNASSSSSSNSASPSAVTASGVSPMTTPSGSGTTDYVPLWTSSSTLGNSNLFQAGSVMEVKGILEMPNSSTATTSAGYGSEPFDLYASVWNSSVGEAVPQHFRWLAEPVSNDTSSASGKLNLQFGTGSSAPVETGLSISNKGVLSFSPGQTFPGTGSGTITAVHAGTDLTGGGTSGSVTLNVDTTKVPQLATANSFSGNQSVSGNISASGTISAGSTISTSGSMSASGNVIASGYVEATDLYSTGFAEMEGSLYAYGSSYGSYGVETADTTGDEGVVGIAEGNSTSTIGVFGESYSSSGTGVFGIRDSRSSEGTNIPEGGGVWGDTSVTDADGIFGTADNGWAGVFYNNSEYDTTLWVENSYSSSGAYGPLIEADGMDGYCYIDGSGNLSCSGSKSAVVAVDSGSRKVALYAVEAPENWFEDFGSGQLASGVAHVALEQVFAQTINSNVEYHVFLTPKGDSKGLYVANESASGFDVRESAGGRSSIAFDYRIVARRKGYEAIRLADRTKIIDGMVAHRQAAKVKAAARPMTPKIQAAPKPVQVAAVHQ